MFQRYLDRVRRYRAIFRWMSDNVENYVDDDGNLSDVKRMVEDCINAVFEAGEDEALALEVAGELIG